METLKLIIGHEGFRNKPYKDTRGILTFGHGLTYITREESIVIVKNRISSIKKKLWNFEWYTRLNLCRKSVIISMVYQLGFSGVMNFKKTIKYLKKCDYEKASIEMLDSAWALQTPNRASEMSEIMRGGKYVD